MSAGHGGVLHCNYLFQPMMALETPILNDRDLVAQYLQGDPNAMNRMDAWIEAAANPYRQRLAHWWEDVQQDIRLKLYELFKKDGFRGDKGLKTYVWKMVNHTCIDQLRKHSFKKVKALEDMEGEVHLAAHDVAELKTTAAQMGLLTILEKVPKECRKLWQMILSGMGYPQMSSQLDISEATLRVRVYRCRKKALALREKVPS